MNFVIRRDYTKTQEMTKLKNVNPGKKEQTKPTGEKPAKAKNTKAQG